MYEKKGQPERAIEAFKQGLPLEEGRREDWVVRIQIHLAQCYQQKRMYKQTFLYAYQALATIKVSTFEYKYYYPAFLPIAWLALSQGYLHTNRLDSALYYAQLCLPTVKEYVEVNYLELPRDVSKVLAEVYAKKGNYA